MEDLSRVGLQAWCSGADGPGTIEIPEVTITPGPDFKPPPASHSALFGVLAGFGLAAAAITVVTFVGKKG